MTKPQPVAALDPLALLHAIGRAQSAFIGHEDLQRAFDTLLEDLLHLSGSQMGFFGTVSDVADTTPQMVMVAAVGMPRPTQPGVAELRQGQVFSDPQTLIGRTLLQRQPVIANPAQTRPLGAQLPPGHPPIISFLGLPILAGPTLVAMAGLANRAGGYSQADVQALQPLLQVVAQLLMADGLHRQRQALQQDLRRSEQRFRAMAEQSPLGMMIHVEGAIRYANRSAAELMGSDAPASLLGRSVLEFVHPDSQALVLQRVRNIMSGIERQPPTEIKAIRLDGAVRHVETTSLRLEFDGATAALVIMTDLSARRAEQARQRLLAGIFEQAREGICLTDLNGRFLDVNPRFCEITGYQRDEVIGQTPRLLHSGRHDAAFYAAMWSALHTQGHWQGEIWNRKKSGEIYPERLSISRLAGDEEATDTYLAVFTDISEVKAQQSRLEHLTHFDALTHLPNRTLLAEHLALARRHARQQQYTLAVCHLDLDSFKSYNDRFGHQFGDQLLLEVALRLRRLLPSTDTVARLGGDEFVLLLGHLESARQCHLRLEQLLAAVAEPMQVEHHPILLSASIGVTLYPQDGADVDTLLRHANQALYAAKDAGRRCYHMFDVLHDQGIRLRRETLAHFEVALRQGQLCLYYQPKVDMRCSRVLGAEGLIRWNHPQQGLLVPTHFLSAISDTAADIALGEWVIRTSLRQMQSWRAQGLDLAVSVNISPYHLAQPDFVERLSRLLAEVPGTPRERLQIEVLENAALEDIGHITTLMHDCIALGVSFALDDFGTGYSSLTYLRRLPAQTLKIDQSFVRDMIKNTDDLAIIEGIIGLTRAFGLEVIAEGVETPELGVMLLQLGCDQGQGYGISRPMAADQMLDWCRCWRPDPVWSLAAGVQCAPADIDLLIVEIDNRRWLEAVRAYLQAVPGSRSRPASQSADSSRFGQWFNGTGKQRHGHRVEFMRLGQQHRNLHRIGDALLALCDDDQYVAALARLPELERSGEQTAQTLHELLIAISMD